RFLRIAVALCESAFIEAEFAGTHEQKAQEKQAEFDGASGVTEPAGGVIGECGQDHDDDKEERGRAKEKAENQKRATRGLGEGRDETPEGRPERNVQFFNRVASPGGSAGGELRPTVQPDDEAAENHTN